MGALAQVSLLECGHLAYFTPGPLIGDTVYCRDCLKYRDVQVVAVEWRWSCRTCRCGRAYGLQERECRQAAQTHLNRFSGHAVSLKNGGTVVELLQGPQDEKLPIVIET